MRVRRGATRVFGPYGIVRPFPNAFRVETRCFAVDDYYPPTGFVSVRRTYVR